MNKPVTLGYFDIEMNTAVLLEFHMTQLKILGEKSPLGRQYERKL